MPDTTDVQAAGVVTFAPGRRVLLVHRPKYDDWSFPKGKLERGEHPTVAAVREVVEETGLRVRLGPVLDAQRYAQGSAKDARQKTVHYWVGRVVGDDDVRGYRPNAEIDGVEWVRYADALERLTYPDDVETLRAAYEVRRKTHALVVLRHGQARSRRSWKGEDVDRPLTATGERAAARLAPVIAAYDVRRVVTSSATRCVQTVSPFCAASGPRPETTRRLTEERGTERRVSKVLDYVMDDRQGVLLCTHRPVLPLIFDALGLEDPKLAPGEMLVAHRRWDEIVATEVVSP